MFWFIPKFAHFLDMINGLCLREDYLTREYFQNAVDRQTFWIYRVVARLVNVRPISSTCTDAPSRGDLIRTAVTVELTFI